LSWVSSEPNKGGDVDFFFHKPEDSEMFKLVIENYGFRPTRQTEYALTCFNPEEKVVIQIVGNGNLCINPNRILFGTPRKVIDAFDLTLCRFAVDADFLYTDTMAIRDLITKSLRYGVVSIPAITTNRIVKYVRKGYYMPYDMIEIKDKPSDFLQPERLPSW
jgi:hypothetical protein